MAAPEDEVDRLFGLPLEEFTSARNELARRLKRAGDEAAAAEVAALEKPSVPVWAINQVARRDAGGLERLLDAGAGLRAAQEALLSGGGDAGALRQAQTAERQAVGDLVERARGVLEEAGRPATRAMLDRISRTLESAAVSGQGRALLGAGRLTAELDPAGFDALAGLEVPARRPARPERDDLAERRRAKEELQLRRRELRQRVSELEREARDAEREAERAEGAAKEARRRADAAREAADGAAEELAGLEPR